MIKIILDRKTIALDVIFKCNAESRMYMYFDQEVDESNCCTGIHTPGETGTDFIQYNYPRVAKH